ncbi:MAG: FAD-dependent oxidoreductase [bacterium]|nr:FAD-dependent oxidoreductase [bacterium]
MAKICIIGAGFAGHTAALYLGDKLGKAHEITVINRSKNFVYIPSLVWVGIDRMDVENTQFDLEKVYSKFNVRLITGKATEVHADEQFVIAEPDNSSEVEKIEYDYILIATGPKLDFEATPGLGPATGNTWSICSPPHASEAKIKYLESVTKMKNGERQRIVIGTGHGGATCQGAALEYITNVHKDLVRRGIREKCDLTYLSNEPELGDFGIRGLSVKHKGEMTSGADFIGAVFEDYGINPMIARAVQSVDKENIYWEDINGESGETGYDYAMLIPRFLGQPMKFIGADGQDIADKIVNPANGLVKVDGIYGLKYDDLANNPDAWPAVYQNPAYSNIFAAGIAFAPPGPISAPAITPNGTALSPAPPRTGMVSGIIGRIVALNIIDLVQKGRMTHSERMTEMAAACIASMGDSLWDGSAAVIMVYPVVPDNRKYPNEQGRDQYVTHMEMGLAGAWMKRMIHTTFMYKLQGKPGWKIIPE